MTITKYKLEILENNKWVSYSRLFETFKQAKDYAVRIGLEYKIETLTFGIF